MNKLFSTGHISKQNYDEVSLQLRSALAQVKVCAGGCVAGQRLADWGRVAVDEAAIRAPFAGTVQARYIDEGSQVSRARRC